MGNTGGRPRQEAALVRRTGKPSWFIRFYDEETKQTRHISTGKADWQAAELVLKEWIEKHAAPAEKPQPRVLPARLPPEHTTKLTYKGRPQHEPKLVRKHDRRQWQVQFYEDGKKRRISTGRADWQGAELFLKDWRKNYYEAGDKRDATVFLAPSANKARKNQYDVGRGADGQLIKPEPQARRDIPDLEAAKKAFGHRMVEARKAAGLSQAQVASALYGPDTPEGTYVNRYRQWEVGISFMTQNVIPVFADIVGTSLDFLFSRER
jgi:hypothetical protein